MDEPIRRRTRNIQAGPRSRMVVEKVLDAVARQLDAVGYGGLSIEDVARLAGVSRSTIYRRWPDKKHLAAALLEPEILRLEAQLSEGSLSDILMGFARQLAKNLAAPRGRTLVHLFLSFEAEFRMLSASARDRALKRLEAILMRARERGEIRADADVAMLAHMFFASLVQWAISHDMSLHEDDSLRIVKTLLSGIQPMPPGDQGLERL